MSENLAYLIVSLDGGGVRCALQIVLLKRIFEKFPSLESKIQLVAGTSAGALVAAGLGALGCKEMLHHMLKQEFAEKIFSETWKHEVRSMRGLYRASYTNKKLAELLAQVFGIETSIDHFHIADKKPHLLFTSFCIDTAEHRKDQTSVVMNTPSKRAIFARSAKKSITRFKNGPATEDMVCGESIELENLSGKFETENVVENMQKTDPVDQTDSKDETLKDEISQPPVDSSWSRWRPNFVSWLPNSFTKTTDCVNAEPLNIEDDGIDLEEETQKAIIQKACQQTAKHEKSKHSCVGKAWHAEIHHTFENKGKDSFVNVLLKSTAAPTYFPAHDGCIDGGIVAQNPSMLAISHALRYEPNLSLERIVLLSIGTGTHPMNMNAYGKNADLGLAQWVPNLMSVFNDGSLDATEINCRNMLAPQNYIRLQLKLEREIDLANYAEWDTLVDWANNYPLDAVFKQIESIFGDLEE